jgi:hypothetical protein
LAREGPILGNPQQQAKQASVYFTVSTVPITAFITAFISLGSVGETKSFKRDLQLQAPAQPFSSFSSSRNPNSVGAIFFLLL